jgi:hypothetical protein
MSWQPEQAEEEAQQLLIQKTAKALPAPKGLEKKAKLGFLGMVSRLLGAIKGYLVDDLNRLKESGVQIVEGKGQKELAEAKAKITEAAERQANAELKNAEAEQIRAETPASVAKIEAETLKLRAEAFATVLDAISKIKQAGGSVVFDSAELLAIMQPQAPPEEKPKELSGPPGE